MPTRTPGHRAPRPAPRITFFGTLGELLISAGVLVMLFLGWQAGWNNFVLEGQQTKAAAAQSRHWLEQSNAATPTAGGAAANTEPPVLAEPADYQPFAVIYIPRLGADWKRTIRQTVDTEKVLNSFDAGVGHYPGTQMPGQVGNFAIAGHDSGWGNTFINLTKLHLSDHIYVQTQDGWYTYTFRNLEYIQPTQIGVIAPVPQQPGATPGDRLMTITTCNPPFHSGERVAAYAAYDDYEPTAVIPTELSTTVTPNGH